MFQLYLKLDLILSHLPDSHKVVPTADYDMAIRLPLGSNSDMFLVMLICIYTMESSVLDPFATNSSSGGVFGHVINVEVVRI